MAHPYFHALSSVRKYGGELETYLPIHTFLDQSKSHIADCRHRLLLHNSFGVWAAKYVFRSMIGVDVGQIARDHIYQDLARIPDVQGLLTVKKLPRQLDVDVVSKRSAERYGGHADDYRELHTFMNANDQWGAVITNTSIGPFLAEQAFGITLKRSDGKVTPTRAAAETHIITACHKIVPAVKLVEDIPMEDWMCRNAAALSTLANV